jgi:hypothetical protein
MKHTHEGHTALDKLAYTLADRACVCDIECNALPTNVDGQGWFDIRAMLDPRELCDETIDMMDQALTYAAQRGLFKRHPDFAHLVRITQEPSPS